jgi:hypothetical protein
MDIQHPLRLPPERATVFLPDRTSVISPPVVGAGDALQARGAEIKSLGKPHVRPMDFTGRPMTGYVYVAPAGRRTDASLRGVGHTRSPLRRHAARGQVASPTRQAAGTMTPFDARLANAASCSPLRL